MLNKIQFDCPIRSRDNDLYQECREFLRNTLYSNMPLEQAKLTLALVLHDKSDTSVLSLIDSMIEQTNQNWNLHIIDDGAGVCDILNKYYNNNNIFIHSFDKPTLFDAPFVNIIAGYAAFGSNANLGQIFAGQVFKKDMVQSVIDMLDSGEDVVCGHVTVPETEVSRHCHRTALFFKRSSYETVGGMEERWATKGCYDWEFIIQAIKLGLKIKDLELLTSENTPKNSIPAIVRKQVEGLRESYVYKEKKICIIVSNYDFAYVEKYLRASYSGVSNTEILVDSLKENKKVNMQEAIDTGASLICKIDTSMEPSLGWLRRLYIASLASEAGVYCEWEPAGPNNVIRSKGIELVKSPHVITSCSLMRKRFIEAYSLYYKTYEEAAEALIGHQMQVIFTKISKEDVPKDLLPSRVLLPTVIRKFKSIRVLCSSDRQGKEVWWGDYWFKLAIEDALRAFGIRVVGSNQVADIDFFLHANKPDMRVRAPIKISWVITRPGAALGQISYFTNFDHVFSLSESAGIQFVKNGISSTYLPCGTTCEYSYDENVEKIYDFCMIGNTSKPRRLTLMNKLSEAGYSGAVYGTGWNKHSHLSHLWKGFYWSNHDLDTIFNKSKLVIYCHWDEMRDKGLVAQRLLDICAMGVPVLTDNNVGLKKYGLDVPTYTTDADFMNKIKSYTRDGSNWTELVNQAKGYSRVARQSDFVVVAEEIVKQLQKQNKI